MTERFEISMAERGSPLWRRLVQHMTARRDFYRVENDAPLDEVQTNLKRGRIRELNDLLALDNPAPGVDP